MDWSVVGYALLGVALLLVGNFLNNLLSPLAKYYGKKLVPDEKGRAKIQGEVRRSSHAGDRTSDDLGRKIVDYVIGAVKPAFLQVAEASYFEAFGISIIVGAVGMIGALWSSWALGFNVLYSGTAACIGFLFAGGAELLQSRRILRRPLGDPPPFPGEAERSSPTPVEDSPPEVRGP